MIAARAGRNAVNPAEVGLLKVATGLSMFTGSDLRLPRSDLAAPNPNGPRHPCPRSSAPAPGWRDRHRAVGAGGALECARDHCETLRFAVKRSSITWFARWFCPLTRVHAGGHREIRTDLALRSPTPASLP